MRAHTICHCSVHSMQRQECAPRRDVSLRYHNVGEGISARMNRERAIHLDPLPSFPMFDNSVLLPLLLHLSLLPLFPRVEYDKLSGGKKRKRESIYEPHKVDRVSEFITGMVLCSVVPNVSRPSPEVLIAISWNRFSTAHKSRADSVETITKVFSGGQTQRKFNRARRKEESRDAMHACQNQDGIDVVGSSCSFLRFG